MNKVKINIMNKKTIQIYNQKYYAKIVNIWIKQKVISYKINFFL